MTDYASNYSAAGAALKSAIAALDQTLVNFEAATRLAGANDRGVADWVRGTAGNGRGITMHAHELAQGAGYAAAVKAAMAAITEA
jgi:hypothetical protein